ncbi:hypothetical protein N8E89_23015 (plasmid) [Phyllobacterium sp. A18/5-2]|uniref:hypothetical protein n=1 Tax=Phyllobacterium sp. A18/5-2 TaxID=2978392 RepID=UPI0021C94027|nr:hypothetical protein [Phyllobacterium sp. A18/5-2]UXN66091.1 hypothetical protein N8E89_23015 [Phyllobacterium sp. A18/5-2]
MSETKELTSKFRRVRMVLAREKGFPAGDPNEGYDLLLPLDETGRLDPAEWRNHKLLCRVRRFRPNREDLHGLLRRKPGGQWYIEYRDGDADDEFAFRWSGEHFIWGEYISIRSKETMHTYRITLVEKP